MARSSLHNCFNSATLEGFFQAWKDCIRSCHGISIRIKSGLWLGHSKTFILFFLSHSEVDLLVCLGSLSCCITQVLLSLRSQTDGRTSPSGFSNRLRNSWFHQLWQVIQVPKLQSSPRPSHYHHHVWLLVWCSFYEILCWFYTRCNGTHTFQKVQLLSHQSTEYLPKSLGDNQDNCMSFSYTPYIGFMLKHLETPMLWKVLCSADDTRTPVRKLRQGLERYNMILETVWRQFPEGKSTTHHVALLTSAQSPLPSLSVSGVVTDHLLCGTRHLSSPVPRMATKINLRCANDRPVNVCPDNSILSSFSLTHTFTTMSWSTHAAGKKYLLCIRYLRGAQKMRSTTVSQKQILKFQSKESHFYSTQPILIQ